MASESDHCCRQPSKTVVKPQVLSSIVNEVRPSESSDNNHRLLCLQHLRYDGKVEQEAGQHLLTKSCSCWRLYRRKIVSYELRGTWSFWQDELRSTCSLSVNESYDDVVLALAYLNIRLGGRSLDTTLLMDPLWPNHICIHLHPRCCRHM